MTSPRPARNIRLERIRLIFTLQPCRILTRPSQTWALGRERSSSRALIIFASAPLVPLPSTFWLAAAGLRLLWRRARRRERGH